MRSFLTLFIIAISLNSCLHFKSKKNDSLDTPQTENEEYLLKNSFGHKIFVCNKDTVVFNDKIKNDIVYGRLVDCLYSGMFNGDESAIYQMEAYFKNVRSNLNNNISPFPSSYYSRFSSTDRKFRGPKMFNLLMSIGDHIYRDDENESIMFKNYLPFIGEMIKSVDGKENNKDYFNYEATDILDIDDDYDVGLLKFYYTKIRNAYDAGLIELKAFGEE